MRNAMPKMRAMIYWGAVWGILEATVGYLLHLPIVNIGWLVWTPLAAWCIARVYRDTGSRAAVVCASIITCAFKLTNLAMPARLDMVINPAVSVVLEALAFACVVTAFKGMPKRVSGALAFSLGFNTLWRGMYALYVLVSPAFIRDVSVISSTQKFLSHMVYQNLATSAVVFVMMVLLLKIKPAKDPLSKVIPSGALAALCGLCAFMQIAL